MPPKLITDPSTLRRTTLTPGPQNSGSRTRGEPGVCAQEGGTQQLGQGWPPQVCVCSLTTFPGLTPSRRAHRQVL